MNELTVFNYGNQPMRTVERDGETWWVLRDVCDVLGIVHPKDVAKRLDEDEDDLIVLTDSAGRAQKMHVVNEAGLYNVILRSDKPEAKDFKRWVTHEVLPSIHRTGSYSMQQPMTPAQLIAAQAQVLVELEAKVEAAESRTAALEAKVDNAVRVFARPSEDHWRGDMDKAIKEMCSERGMNLLVTKGKMYEELEDAAACNVDARLRGLRTRMKRTGMRRRDYMELTKLDAIAADKRLRPIFEGIVRKWQARGA